MFLGALPTHWIRHMLQYRMYRLYSTFRHRQTDRQTTLSC